MRDMNTGIDSEFLFCSVFDPIYGRKRNFVPYSWARKLFPIPLPFPIFFKSNSVIQLQKSVEVRTRIETADELFSTQLLGHCSFAATSQGADILLFQFMYNIFFMRNNLMCITHGLVIAFQY